MVKKKTAKASASPRLRGATAFPRAERVHAYARDVVAGKIVAGRYVVAACRRHLDDLQHGWKRGLVFNPARAESVLDFFEEVLFLKDGHPFKLEPFQTFIQGSIFGWLKYDGDPRDLKPVAAKKHRTRKDPIRVHPCPSVVETLRGQFRRRFRVAYVEEGKGNGKTPQAAGTGLYGLTIDLEEAPEVYAFAYAKDQAKICHTDAKRMVMASPDLQPHVQILTNNLSAPARMGKFAILSSEDKGHHGLRVHMGLGDEVHVHASAAMVNTIEAGTKNCRNSLIFLITNAGSDRTGPCWKYRERSLKALDRYLTGTTLPANARGDDELFAYVCALDPCPKCLARGKKQPDPKCKRCDQIEDERVWLKANPGLGTILDRDYVRRRVDLARTMPSMRNHVLQLNFCHWTDTDNGWLDMYSWRNRCHDPKLRLADFLGQPCALGLDAANRVDATCLALIFSLGGEAIDPANLPAAAQEAIKEAMQNRSSLVTGHSEPEAPANAPAIVAGGYALFLRTYVPQAMVDNQSAANHESYQLWAQSGPDVESRNSKSQPDLGHSDLGPLDTAWLTVTPGAITDFGRILDDLRWINDHFIIKRLQADPRELGYLLQQAGEFIGEDKVVQVSQGATMISQPMKLFEGLTAAALIRHDGNPVLDWMLGNIVQQQTRSSGPVKYYYPRRPTESQKIDAGPASFMALDGLLRATEPETMPGMMMLG